MKIDCCADLHGHLPDLEGGDLLIIAGDITASDKICQWSTFYRWMEVQKYKKIIYVAGNHDNHLIDSKISKKAYFLLDEKEKPIYEYICDSGTEFEGLKIWGSPWTLAFEGMNPHVKAFTKETEHELWMEWEKIPDDTDILITHSPPYKTLDKTLHGLHVGSSTLYGQLKYKLRPKLHVYGHIHEGYGQIEKFPGRISVNASIMNVHYQPVNKPIRIEL